MPRRPTTSLGGRAGRFATYGALGWIAEVVFTAVETRVTGRVEDWRLEGHTYLWMFPIYGLAAVIFEPAHDRVRALPWPVRAGLYATGFLAVEYGTGQLLKRLIGECPWDYSGSSRFAVDGVVRLDYAPLWAVAGMLLERVDDRLRPGHGAP